MKRFSLLLLALGAPAFADQPATTPNNRQATAHAPDEATTTSSIDDSGAGRTDQTEPPPFGREPVTPPRGAQIDAALINQLVDARLKALGDTAGWDNGFYIQNREHTARLKIGGVTQFDGRFFVPRDSDPKVDQFGFRSIRPDLQGTVFEHYDFRLFPDFAGGKLVVQDAYADVRYGDAVKLRVGKFKVPFGLERLQSESDTTFVERGLPTQLAPNRDLGIQVFGELAGGVVAYQVGIFNGVADGQSGDGDVSTGKEGAARVFVKPFSQGSSVVKQLGIGGAVTYGDTTGTLVATDLPIFKTQGQTTFFQYKVGTTLIDTPIADGRHWRASGQADYFVGPLGVLAEYVHSAEHVSLATSHAIVQADAWQALGQWVLTGDDASYKSVTPKHAFDPSKGHYGAFDVTARVGELRFANSDVFDAGLADPAKSARRVWNVGAGLDWFPNKTFRVVLDYDRTWFRLGAKTGDRPTETSIVGRVQTAF